MSELTSLDPSGWGPSFWTVLQQIAIAYPEENPSADLQKTTKTFLETLKTMLPCSECRKHYKAHWDEHPPALSNRNDLLEWLKQLKERMPNKKPEVPVPATRAAPQQETTRKFPTRINPRVLGRAPAAKARQQAPHTSLQARYAVLQKQRGRPGCRSCGGGGASDPK